jgi:hypothetical protein
MKDVNIDLNFTVLMTFAAATIITLIITLASGAQARTETFAKNMETAMSKGVDPIAVKCAYDEAKSEVCITYVLTHK